MQSSATEPGSIALSILLWETQKEEGPSMRPPGADTTLVPISSGFRAMRAIRPVCQPDTINMLLGVKLFLKPTKRLLAEFEGGFMNEEWSCLFKHSTFQIIWEISILVRAFAIKRIHSTFHNCQNCQNMTRYLWTCVHTHIHTSDLFFQNSDWLIHSCRIIWPSLLLSDSICYSRAFIKA